MREKRLDLGPCICIGRFAYRNFRTSDVTLAPFLECITQRVPGQPQSFAASQAYHGRSAEYQLYGAHSFSCLSRITNRRGGYQAPSAVLLSGVRCTVRSGYQLEFSGWFPPQICFAYGRREKHGFAAHPQRVCCRNGRGEGPRALGHTVPREAVRRGLFVRGEAFSGAAVRSITGMPGAFS